MTRTEPIATAAVLLFKGGPGLIDLFVDVNELHIAITGPRMLFDHLEMVTTLSAFDGWTVRGLRELAQSLEGSVHCGLVGIQPAPIAVESRRSGAVLRIDVGPPSMYQSELLLRTRSGETFRALIERIVNIDRSRPVFVGLHAVTASGHLPEFLGALRRGVPEPVNDCVFRNPVPSAARPGWWPEGVTGYAILAGLADQFGRKLARGSVGVGWPPTTAATSSLTDLVVEQPGVHPLWYFWTVVEQGHPQVAAATHNRAHN